MDFTDLTRATGLDTTNMGGTLQKFYFALADDVETWPSLPASPLTIATAMVLTGNFNMKHGKKFFEGYMTAETGEVRDEQIGDKDGVSHKHIFELFHPGMKDALLGFMRLSNNSDMVFLIPDTDGDYRVVGNENFPARKESSTGTTGKARSDRRGATLTFSSFGSGPAPLYRGTIPLTEDVSGS